MWSKAMGKKTSNRISKSRVLIVIKGTRVDKNSYDLFVIKSWGYTVCIEIFWGV